MDTTTPARLYDGVRATPFVGTVRLRAGRVEFECADRVSHDWHIDRVVSLNPVGPELHIEIAAPERDESVGVGSERTADPALNLKLVVEDRSFEEQLLVARGQFASIGGFGLFSRLRRLSIGSWTLIACLTLPAAWWLYTSLLPHAHVLVSTDREVALGELVHEALVDNWDVVEDDRLSKLLSQMVEELSAEDSPYEIRVTVVKDDTPNAFAAPGGRIVVFTGLLQLCPDPDVLAGVLAHEIAHVEQRHSLKRLLRAFGVAYFATSVIGGGIEEFATAETLSELSSGLLVLQHSREQERESDRIAVAKLQHANRSQSGLARFFAGIQTDETRELESGLAWLSTHPTSDDRIEQIGRLVDSNEEGARPWIASATWMRLRERILEDAQSGE